MPRGKYKRKPRKDETTGRMTYDISQGGYVDLTAANTAIAELKDRIAQMNFEREAAKAQHETDTGLIERQSRTIDALLTAVEMMDTTK